MVWLERTPSNLKVSSSLTSFDYCQLKPLFFTEISYFITMFYQCVEQCHSLPLFLSSVSDFLFFIFLLYVHLSVGLYNLWQALPQLFNGANYFWGADLAQKHFLKKHHFNVSFNICQGASMSWKPGQGMHRHAFLWWRCTSLKLSIMRNSPHHFPRVF